MKKLIQIAFILINFVHSSEEIEQKLKLSQSNEILEFVSGSALNKSENATLVSSAIENNSEVFFSGGIDNKSKLSIYAVFQKQKKISGVAIDFELAPKFIDVYLCEDDLDDDSCLLQTSQFSVLDLPDKIYPYGDDVEISLANVFDPEMASVFSKGRVSINIKFFPEFTKKVFLVMYGFNYGAKIREEVVEGATPKIKELGYIAIRYLRAFNYYQDVLIRSKLIADGPERCILQNIRNRKEQFLQTQKLEVGSCLSALYHGDGREMFVMGNSGAIRSKVVKDYCLSVNSVKDAQPVKLNMCDDTEKFSNFQLTKTGLLKIVENSIEKCVSISTQNYNYIDDVANEVVKSSSAEMANLATIPGIGGEAESHFPWRSEKQRDSDFVSINFGDHILPIKLIIVRFSEYPKSFEIIGFNQFEEQVTICKEEEYSPKIDPVSQEVNAEYTCLSNLEALFSKIEVHLRVKQPGFEEYGIKSINISAESYGLQLQDCPAEGETDPNYEFIVSNVMNLVNVKQSQHLRFNYDILFKSFLTSRKALKSANSKEFANLYKQFKIHYQKLHDKATNMDKKMSEVDAEKARVMEGKAAADEEQLNPIGTSKNPALSCEDVKSKYPTKKSGYYFLKTDCMQVPLKVYCDLEIAPYRDIYIHNAFLGKGEIVSSDSLKTTIGKPTLRTHLEVKQFCASVGLYPINIKEPEEFYTLISLLMDQKFDLNNNKFIPLAYDYTCATQQGCSKKYSSLDGGITDTTNLFMIFKQLYFQTQNTNELKFSSPRPDVVGIMNEKIDFFELEKTLDIQGVPCSTNPKPHSSNDSISLSCNSTLTTNKELKQGLTGNSFTVECPAYCSQTEMQVYGVAQYHPSSSVCKAGIHSGAIDISGGRITLTVIDPPQNGYLSEVQNSIFSKAKEFSANDKVAFKVESLVSVCPDDKLKKLGVNNLSFAQVKMASAFGDHEFNIENLDDFELSSEDQNGNAKNYPIGNNEKDPLDQAEEILSNSNEISLNANDLNTATKIDEPSVSQLNSDTSKSDQDSIDLVSTSNDANESENSFDKAYSQMPYSQDDSNSDSDDSNTNSDDSNTPSEPMDGFRFKSTSTQDAPTTPTPTPDASQLTDEETEQEKILQAKQTTTNYKLNYVPLLLLYMKSLVASKVNQKNKLEDLRVKDDLNRINSETFKTASEVISLTTKVQNKEGSLLKSINSLKLLTVSRLNMEMNTDKYLKQEMFYFEFQKDYTENITISPEYNEEDPLINNTIKTKYKIYDMGTPLDGYEYNSNWNIIKVTDEHLGNISVLTNTSNIHNILYPAFIGTRLILKERELFDFDLNLGISHVTRADETSSAGVIFRFIDHSNYYALEIKHKVLTLFKMKKGEYTKLHEMKIFNIFDESNFVFFKIVAIKTRFKFYIKKDCHFKVNEAELKVAAITNGPQDDSTCTTDQPDMLFEFLDVDHQKGKVGFFSDGSTKLQVNYLGIKARECTPSDFAKPKFIFSKNCSRFNYALESDSFENLWEFKDDVMVVEKVPSQWHEVKDLELKFTKGIVQEADIITKNGAIATWLDLKETNVCEDGNLQTMFKVEGTGRFALVFRKEEENKFFYVELDLTNKDDKLANPENREFMFKINVKRRLMNPLNQVIEKFMAAAEIQADLMTIKFSSWYNISVEFIGPTIKVFMSQEYFGLKEVFSYTLSAEEQADKWKNGTIGFGTYGLKGLKLAKVETRPKYNEKLRPIPSVEPGEEPKKDDKSDMSLEDQLNEDEEEKEPKEEEKEDDYDMHIRDKNGDDFYQPVDIRGIDMSKLDMHLFNKCFAMKSQVDRSNFCNAQMTDSARTSCGRGFCSYCCRQVMPKPWAKYKSFACEKTCMDLTTKEETTDVIDKCVEPEDVSKTMYQYCMSSKVGHEQVYCMRDVCDACCASANMTTLKNYDSLLIQRCSFSCWRKFYIKSE